MEKVIVIHDGNKVLSVHILEENTTIYGDKSFVVDDKATAIAIAQLLSLDNIELIENFEFPIIETL